MAGLEDSVKDGLARGEQARSAIYNWLTTHGTAAYVAGPTSATIGSIIAAVVIVIYMLFGIIFRIASELAVLFFQGIENVRDSNAEALNELIAAAVSDVLGITVTAGDMPEHGAGAANVERFRAIGEKVLGAITTELGGTPSDNPGAGEQGAAGFMGFSLNFAVSAALIGIIGELSSLGFIKEFAEVGEEIRGALGLGRLMRLAVQPLVHALVTVPYTRESNFKYRPHQLSVAEYVAAWQAGRLDETELSNQLGQLGFSDAYIGELKTQHLHRLSVHQIEQMVRWGKLAQDEAHAMLKTHGMDDATATAELNSVDLERADHEETAYAAEILKLAQQRFITPEVYSTLIQGLHFSAVQQQGWLNRLGVFLDSETKRLTIGELLYLAEHNLATLDQLDAWMKAEGYNADAAAMLELYLDQKILDFQAAQKAKAAKAAGKGTKNPPPTPPPAG